MLEYLIHSVTCCDEIWEGQGGPVERKNISFPLKQKACCKLLLVNWCAVQLLCYVELIVGLGFRVKIRVRVRVKVKG